MGNLENQLKQIDDFSKLFTDDCDVQKDAKTTMLFLITHFAYPENKREELKIKYNVN